MGVWKMATPFETRVILPDSFRYLMYRINNEIEQISDISKWDGIINNSDIMKARVKLGFEAISSCSKLAQEIVNNELEIEYNDK